MMLDQGQSLRCPQADDHLSWTFIAVKNHHDHSNSYKEKHLIGAGLQFQRFSPLSSWWEAWQRAGRHGAEELRTLHLDPQTARRDCVHSEHRRPQSPLHSDALPPIRPHLLIVPLPMGQTFKCASPWGHSYSNHHIPLSGL